MSQAQLSNNFLDLDGNVRLTASGANTLDLEGVASADVDVSGIDTLTFNGELNTGTNELGGYLFAFRGEFGTSSFSSPTKIPESRGDAAILTAGNLVPNSGVALFLSFYSSTSTTATFELIGSTSGTLLTINASGITQDTVTGSASFNANEIINLQLTSGSCTEIRFYYVLRFD